MRPIQLIVAIVFFIGYGTVSWTISKQTGAPLSTVMLEFVVGLVPIFSMWQFMRRVNERTPVD